MNLIYKLIACLPAPVVKTLSRLSFARPGWKYLLRKPVDRLALALRKRDGVIVQGVGRGLRFNVGTSRVGFLLGTVKPQLQAVMAAYLKPGMIYYDAGANVGYFACIASRLVGPSGHVFCFEPVPENCRSLEHNAELNGFLQLRVWEGALGAHNGDAAFFHSSESTWGALASIGREVPGQTRATEVSVKTLDAVRESERLPPPDWIKIDVEGSELDVLLGAERTLAECRPLIAIELHGTNREVAAHLEKIAYVAVSLGTELPLAEAHWNITTIAVPRERERDVAWMEANRLKAV